MLIPPPVVPSASPSRTPSRSVPEPPVIETREQGNLVDDEFQNNESRWNGVAGFLASLALHLIVLITLALLVRPESSPFNLVMELTATDTGDMALETADVVSIDAPVTADATEQMASVNLEVFEDLSEVELPSLGSSPNPTDSIAAGADPPDANAQPETKKQQGIRFFGTQAYGNSFVYVLDMSGSMAAGGGGRMARARNELLRSISELQPHQTFCVLLYSNWVRQMFDDRPPQIAFPQSQSPETKLYQATPEVKKRVSAWLRSIRPNGGTRPAHALRIAGRLEPDAVFFLSDGEFEYEPPAGVNSAVEGFLQGFGSARPSAMRRNVIGPYPKEVLAGYDPKIVVHTVALESEASRRMMKRISDEKGGQHMFIPAPGREGMNRRQAAR